MEERVGQPNHDGFSRELLGRDSKGIIFPAENDKKRGEEKITRAYRGTTTTTKTASATDKTTFIKINGPNARPRRARMPNQPS